jgi:hypothetical protein
MNNRNGKDVQLGGLTGIVLATVLAGGVSMLIVAGAKVRRMAGNAVADSRGPRFVVRNATFGPAADHDE